MFKSTSKLFRNTLPSRLFLLLALFFSLPLQAQPVINTFDLVGLHNAERSGIYDKIFLRVQQQGVNFDLKHNPVLRTRHAFETKTADCISPSDSPYTFPTVKSKPLNQAKAFIFRRKSDGSISEPINLKGLTVGATKGMKFGVEFEKTQKSIGLKLERVRDIELNYKKLLTHRIDAFIAYTPDIWNLFNSRELPELIYDPKSPIRVLSDSVVCHQTPANEAFIHQFNVQLEKLDNKGALKELLGISYNFD